MTAFEIHVNGKRRCLAGIAKHGVASAILSWIGRRGDHPDWWRENIILTMGGLDARRKEHVDWLETEVKSGDEVLIRLVDVSKVDRPIKGSRRPVGNPLRGQKAYVRRQAKKFGWKIVTK